MLAFKVPGKLVGYEFEPEYTEEELRFRRIQRENYLARQQSSTKPTTSTEPPPSPSGADVVEEDWCLCHRCHDADHLGLQPQEKRCCRDWHDGILYACLTQKPRFAGAVINREALELSAVYHNSRKVAVRGRTRKLVDPGKKNKLILFFLLFFFHPDSYKNNPTSYPFSYVTIRYFCGLFLTLVLSHIDS
jgi:hypothetical protein